MSFKAYLNQTIFYFENKVFAKNNEPFDSELKGKNIRLAGEVENGNIEVICFRVKEIKRAAERTGDDRNILIITDHVALDKVEEKKLTDIEW